MDVIGLGLIVVGLAWFGGFGLAHSRATNKAKAAAAWPSAAGKILSTEVVVDESGSMGEDGTTWYNPVVNYSYDVAGTEFQGHRLRFGNPHCSNRKKAEAAIAPYTVGSPVTVHYNPEKPSDAVLETGKPSPIYLILALFGLPFVAFGLAWSQFTGHLPQ